MLRRKLGVIEEHRRLFGRVFRIAAEEAPPGSPEELFERLAEAHPEGAAELGLLRRCGAGLPEVLRGRAEGLELLFSGTPSAEALYRESPGYRALNALAGEVVASAVSPLPQGRRLRVLEVGAGTGGTTAALLPALPEGQADYTYTDISAGFFGEAERRFGGTEAGMEYRVLDIERDPGEQGFAAHRHDVVVAANVLHATRDLGESLMHCRRLLAPSGMLVLVEGVEARAWLDLTFGMLPGWWRFADRYREDHPLVEPEVWWRALAQAGYGEAAVAGTGSGQAVIVARGPAEVAAAAGLFVLADGDAFGDELTNELRRRRQTVLRGPAGGDREAWRSFLASLPEDIPLQGVAHLGALSGGGDLEEDVRGALSSALALTQGLQDAGAARAAGVWFVTRGGQVLGGEDDGALSGAALWGFGRTADRELADLPVRMLDLDPGTAAPVGRLAEELLFPDRETEVVYRGEARRTPRLARLAPAPPAVPRLRGDRSYLVTGGLGGIGLRLAAWLADRGAGAVVLNGRRAPDPAAGERIAALEARGVEVRVQVADVADGAAVDRMLEEIAGPEVPPLGGVFHAAGVLADAALPEPRLGQLRASAAAQDVRGVEPAPGDPRPGPRPVRAVLEPDRGGGEPRTGEPRGGERLPGPVGALAPGAGTSGARDPVGRLVRGGGGGGAARSDRGAPGGDWRGLADPGTGPADARPAGGRPGGVGCGRAPRLVGDRWFRVAAGTAGGAGAARAGGRRGGRGAGGAAAGGAGGGAGGDAAGARAGGGAVGATARVAAGGGNRVLRTGDGLADGGGVAGPAAPRPLGGGRRGRPAGHRGA